MSLTEVRWLSVNAIALTSVRAFVEVSGCGSYAKHLEASSFKAAHSLT
jgi:hypothetical protein